MATANHTGAGRTAPPRAFTDADAQKFLKRAYDALHAKQYKEAGDCCVLVLKYRPKEVGAHFLIGLVSAEMGKWPMARQAFQNVISLDDTHAAGWAQLARSFVMLGQYSNAEKAVTSAVEQGSVDPLVQDVIGTVYSFLGDQKLALVWFDKACSLSDNPLFELSRAKSLTFLGRLQDAQVSLEAVIAAEPAIAQAHWMLSRVQKAETVDHISEMEALSASSPENSAEQPFLHYAIGKEYEDLGEWDKAFSAYIKGADVRRKEVPFDEKAEMATFDSLKESFTQDWLKNCPIGHKDISPIFVVGQPRTGTTLIERIITAHSDVESAGELQQFSMAIKRLVGVTAPGPLTAEAVRKACDVDVAKLGQLYMATTANMRGENPRFVDKMPVNYLYVPLIAAALPDAKIIHVVRDPMDSCVASYKQLFADAYFHSYDQSEMARHHLRYRDLMSHWRDLLGDRILDVHYEDAVSDLEPNAKKIIKFLELEWQTECVDFHLQDSAVTTASAAQVREKAHTRSIGRWKKYDSFLEPMKTVFEAANLLIK